MGTKEDTDCMVPSVLHAMNHGALHQRLMMCYMVTNLTQLKKRRRRKWLRGGSLNWLVCA